MGARLLRTPVRRGSDLCLDTVVLRDAADGEEVEIEVQVSASFQPAERRTHLEPGCDAGVEDVTAWVQLPDGRDVEFPLTAAERGRIADDLLERALEA